MYWGGGGGGHKRINGKDSPPPPVPPLQSMCHYIVNHCKNMACASGIIWYVQACYIRGGGGGGVQIMCTH